jgi:hypothetical protein
LQSGEGTMRFLWPFIGWEHPIGMGQIMVSSIPFPPPNATPLHTHAYSFIHLITHSH